MVQLIYKHVIRAAESSDILLKMVENPITKHLPMNRSVVELTKEGPLVPLNEFVQKYKETDEVVFVIGGFAHGHVNVDYSTEKLAISEFPLSAAAVAARVTAAFEGVWGVM